MAKEKPKQEERKKVEKKPIPVVIPKKRVESKPEAKVESKPESKVKKTRAPKNENKFIRVALDAKPEERVGINEKVKNGLIKWAYYAVDGDKGYHYYLEIIK